MNEELKCDPYADFMDALFHCDTVTVSLKGIGATDWDTETIHKAILHKTAPTAASAWRTDAPPRDGTTFLAKINKMTVLVKYESDGVFEFQAGSEDFASGLNREDIIAWASITPYTEGKGE